MLIPSIDLQGGRVVQLVQGERLAIESDDLDGWIARFQGRTKVQVIDLDAAKGVGSNAPLVTRACAALPCRVGGGIRDVAAAERVLALGAGAVIVSSAFFSRDGAVDIEFASALARAVSPARIIAAVDSRAGRVVVHGWRTPTALTPVAAVRLLEPYVGEFLYTHVDREGLMGGTDMGAIEQVAAATARPVTAAGGITTAEEVHYLHGRGIDAVVGMALYTGRLRFDDLP